VRCRSGPSSNGHLCNQRRCHKRRTCRWSKADEASIAHELVLNVEAGLAGEYAAMATELRPAGINTTTKLACRAANWWRALKRSWRKR